MPINIEIIDNETFFPQPRSAKCPTIKALTKKPKINPPVGPIKYIRPPPNAKTDSISIIHKAHSRDGFALGAVIAAEWIISKKGVFSMNDLLFS